MQQSLPLNDSEELLRKTSQLHEALRNRKLLRFALLEAKTMRPDVPERVGQLAETLRIGDQLLEEEKEEAKGLERERMLMKGEIEQQRNELNRLQQEQQRMERQIRRQTHHLQQKASDGSYPSVQQMRLQGNNTTNQAHLDQLKQQIHQHKLHLQHLKTRKQSAQKQQQVLSQQLKRQNGLLCIMEKENIRNQNFRSLNKGE